MSFKVLHIPINKYQVSIERIASGYINSGYNLEMRLYPPQVYDKDIYSSNAGYVTLRFGASVETGEASVRDGSNWYVDANAPLESFDHTYKIVQTEKPLYFNCFAEGDEPNPPIPIGKKFKLEMWYISTAIEAAGEGPIDSSPGNYPPE
jgi:hypothetical protein